MHAALPFYSAERADCSGAAVAGANSRLNISVTKGISIVDGGVSKEIVEGLGPYVLSVSVAPSAGNQSCESECLSPNITYQRAASDTLASRAASAVSSPELGPKRRKSSILSFGSPVSSNESGKDVKQPLPTRRRSVAMFSAFNGGQPSHNGNVELLDFGVDSAKMMNQWYNAIFEISRSDKI